MDVPDKIYRLQTTGNRRLNSMYYKLKPAKIRYDDKIIEYIRTDAFIEKACEWLEDHIYEYLIMNRTMNEPDYDSKLIRDFRNNLKEE